MLKISVIDSRTVRRLVLEGTFITPWVGELRTMWTAANADLQGRQLVLDFKNGRPQRNSDDVTACRRHHSNLGRGPSVRRERASKNTGSTACSHSAPSRGLYLSCRCSSDTPIRIVPFSWAVREMTFVKGE
jgi:hypothetical protein